MPDPRRASIYGLVDPRDGSIRYIGKANDPASRLKGHMRDRFRRDTPVYRWMRKVGMPGLVVLSADCDDWRQEERRLIAEARARGDRLLNVADGGDEPYCPPEVRSNNGRRVSASRPQGVMRAYRVLECHIRVAERHETGRAEYLRAKYEGFKRSVMAAREAGRLSALDEALTYYFARRP